MPSLQSIEPLQSMTGVATDGASSNDWSASPGDHSAAAESAHQDASANGSSLLLVISDGHDIRSSALADQFDNSCIVEFNPDNARMLEQSYSVNDRVKVVHRVLSASNGQGHYYQFNLPELNGAEQPDSTIRLHYPGLRQLDRSEVETIDAGTLFADVVGPNRRDCHVIVDCGLMSEAVSQALIQSCREHRVTHVSWYARSLAHVGQASIESLISLFEANHYRCELESSARSGLTVIHCALNHALIELGQFREQHEILQKSHQLLSEQLNLLLEEHDDLGHRNASQTALIEAQQAELITLRDTLTALQRQLENRESEFQEVRVELDQRSQQYEQQQAECNELKTRNAQLMLQLDEQNKLSSDLTVKNAATEQMLQQTRAALEDSQQTNQEFEAVKLELAELRQQLSDATSERINQHEMIAQLQRDAAELAHYRQGLASLGAALNELNTTGERADSTTSDGADSQHEMLLPLAIEELRRQRTELADLIFSIEELGKLLITDRPAGPCTLTQAYSTIGTIREQVISARAELADKISDIQQLQEARDTMLADNQTLDSHLIEQRTTVRLLTQQLTLKNNDLVELQQQYMALGQQYDEQQQLLDRVEAAVFQELKSLSGHALSEADDLARITSDED